MAKSRGKLNVLSFKKNFSWSLFSSISFAASQWLIISMLAKLGSLEMIGYYTLGLAITAPIFLFLSLNLRVVLATDNSKEEAFPDYLIMRIITSAIALTLVLVIIFLFEFDSKVMIISFLIALVKLVESISDICSGKFQQIENMKLMAISKILRSILSIVAFSFALFFFEDLEIALLFQLIFWLLILFLYDLSIISKKLKIKIFSKKPSYRTIKSLVIFSLPLGVAATLDSLNTNIPRYFISYFLNEESLGIFGGITYLMLIGQTLITAVSQVTIPRFSKYYINDKQAFKKLLSKLLLISTVIGLIGIGLPMLYGNSILKLVYSEEFVGHSQVFVICMIAALIWYLSGVLNAAIMATREFKMQIPIFLVAVIMTTISSSILIPSFGLIGAAISLIVGHLTRFLIAIVVMKKLLRN